MPKIVDYTDSEGYKRRVAMPDNALPDENPETGIPLSVDISGLIPDFDPVTISNYLFERGLIEPKDFLEPTATPIIMEVLRRFYKLDSASIQSHAIKQLRGKRNG